MFSHSRHSGGVFVGSVLAALALTAFPGSAPAAGEQPGVFVSLSGNWAGDGMVSTKAGTNERIRCRATYVVNSRGDILQQKLLCASDSYKFDTDSTMNYDNGSITGTWLELTEGVVGELKGLVYPDRISGGVHGSLFTAKVAVITDGNKQSVNIEPTGTSIQAIFITMNKR